MQSNRNIEIEIYNIEKMAVVYKITNMIISNKWFVRTFCWRIVYQIIFNINDEGSVPEMCIWSMLLI